ncbi:MAG: hypothetical protein JO213_09145, partial [Alphaproteobacteria bacterium]|nr:hypothetical protein [Alphaproteobacteria bacterium]
VEGKRADICIELSEALRHRYRFPNRLNQAFDTLAAILGRKRLQGDIQRNPVRSEKFEDASQFRFGSAQHIIRSEAEDIDAGRRQPPLRIIAEQTREIRHTR